MFRRRVSGFICIFVAMVIGTNYSVSGSTIGAGREVTVSSLRTDNLESSTEKPVLEVKEASEVDLEPTAATSAPAPADSRAATATASQPHSGHGRTPASAAPTTAACSSRPTNDTAVSLLGRLSELEKDRHLIGAAEDGEVETLLALLVVGANVETRDWFNSSALHWAAKGGHVEVVRCLIERGAEVDAKNLWQNTPLHWAARNDHEAVVRQLVASSATLNVQNRNGWTPLHLAAYEGHAAVASALLEAGADRSARTKDGDTPLDLARQYNRHQLIDLLR